jgi:hypothetical protein
MPSGLPIMRRSVDWTRTRTNNAGKKYAVFFLRSSTELTRAGVRPTPFVRRRVRSSFLVSWNHILDSFSFDRESFAIILA